MIKSKLHYFFIFIFSIFLTEHLFAQSINIVGKVSDAADAQGLISVNIGIKDGKTLATTDIEGNYTVKAESNAILVFSYVGYQTKEVAVKGKTTINVELLTDEKVLNDVVVTGYGLQNKRESSGSVAVVKLEKIRQVPLASFDQILQGQAPGLLVISNSGQPGQSATVRLRGVSSLSGANSPLYILDGVQITAANFTSLNPEDFETINVLKDATATAIYGSRGANGVIVITSKKGKAGKLKIEYSGLYGTTDYPQNPVELMSSSEKVDYELLRGGTFISKLSKEEQDKLRAVNTNWESLVFQQGKTNQHQLSMSGGTEALTFYASGNLFNQSGTVRGTGVDRYTARVNVQGKQGNVLFGINTSIGFSDYQYVAESDRSLSAPLNALRWANTYETAYQADGKTYTDLRSGSPNPVRELLERKRQINELKGVGSAYLQYNFPFLNGFYVRSNWGTDYENWDETIYASKLSSAGGATQGKSGFLARDNKIQNRVTGTNSLNYTQTLGNHYFNAGVYQESVQFNISNFGYTGYGLTGVLQNEAGLTPGTPTNDFIPGVDGRKSRNALLSYFTNVTYGYKEKYYINVAGRRDGSSRFGKDNRWANFGAVGASWVISEEGFLKNNKNISYLKLKLSYGRVGNQEGIGSFASKELYGSTNYEGRQGNVAAQLGNPELKWEQKDKLNVGLEYEMFKGRLAGSVEVYDELTSNLFLNFQLSRTTGYGSLRRNFGKLQNKGIEVAFNTINVRSGDFEWLTNFNFTYNKNTVKQLAPDTPKDGIVSGFYVTKEGLPTDTYFLVEWAGVNPENGNAIYKKLDGTTTETYNPADKKTLGTSVAPYFGGITNTFRFKGIELSTFFSYAFGHVIYNFPLADLVDPNFYTDNVAKVLNTEWRKPGDITDYPRNTQALQNNVTRFLEKGDFLRLRNVTLAYNLPKSLLQKAKMSTCRIFVQGQNLATFTKFKGYDPEIVGTLNGGQYPAMRQMTVGANIGF